MSATRDKKQHVKFLYSNLYQIYRNGKEAALASPGTNPGLRVDQAIKGKPIPTKNLKGQVVSVREYTPPVLHRRPVPPAPQRIPQPNPNYAVQSLKSNLEKLNDLHSRLRFMLHELEDLVKED